MRKWVDRGFSGAGLMDPPSGVRMDASASETWPDLDRDRTIPDRTFWADGRFRAVMSLGAIVSGHALLLPEPSVAHFNRARSLHDVVAAQGLGEVLSQAVEQVKEILGRRFVGAVCFEHGGSRSSMCPSGCGTAYPHLHIVPGEFAIAEAVAEMGRWQYDAVVEHESLMRFFESRRGPGEYLVVSDDSSTFALWSGEDRRFPSQMLRQAVQRALGMPVNRWQDDPRAADAIALAEEFRAAKSSLRV